MFDKLLEVVETQLKLSESSSKNTKCKLSESSIIIEYAKLWVGTLVTSALLQNEVLPSKVERTETISERDFSLTLKCEALIKIKDVKKNAITLLFMH